MIYFTMIFIVIAALASSKVENPQFQDNAREEMIQFELHASREHLKAIEKQIEKSEQRLKRKQAHE